MLVLKYNIFKKVNVNIDRIILVSMTILTNKLETISKF